MRALVLLVLLAACPAPQPPRVVDSPLARIEASADLDGKQIGPSPTARATIVILMASWCGHCRATLDQLDHLRAAHPNARIVGVNYKGHEEYDNRGNAAQLRAYVTDHVPWLRVVPADESLFRALGKPPFVPAVWVYDARGQQIEFYDRRVREPPSSAELEALLARLGA